MEVNKPVVKIKDAQIIPCFGGDKILSGIPIDYPKDHMVYEDCVTNGRPIYTSKIVERSGDFVETLRTVYHVQNWIDSEAQ